MGNHLVFDAEGRGEDDTASEAICSFSDWASVGRLIMFISMSCNLG
jgi:hypothetical protein